MSGARSVPGQLSECLIENDADAMQRGRSLRRRALAISLVAQAIALGVMLAWPLLYPSTLNATYVLTPVPPYRRGAAEKPRAPEKPQSHPRAELRPVLEQPTVIPSHVDMRPEPPPAIDPSTQAGTEPDLNGVIPGFEGGTDGCEPGGTASHVLPRPPEQPITLPQNRSEGVMEAMLIRRVQPDYPKFAQTMRLSGTVQLRAIIGTDGTVQQLSVVSGSPILARAALDAVRQWRYRPTLLNRRPVEVETLITVKFTLN